MKVFWLGFNDYLTHISILKFRRCVFRLQALNINLWKIFKLLAYFSTLNKANSRNIFEYVLCWRHASNRFTITVNVASSQINKG